MYSNQAEREFTEKVRLREAIRLKDEALELAIAMLDPENQPPQWTIAEALEKLVVARQHTGG